MTSLNSKTLDHEDPFGEVITFPTLPIVERFAFLPLGEGGLALVYGPADEQLIENLNLRYRQVITHNSLIENRPETHAQLHHRESDSEYVHPRQELADLILVLWPSIFQSPNIDWLVVVFSDLAPGGQVIIIECADRPALPNQLLTLELLELWNNYRRTQITHSTQISTDDDIMERLTKAGATHPRAKIFTDPDLIATSDFWFTILNNLRTNISSGDGNSHGNATRVEKINDIFTRAKSLPLATPPIQMITAGFSPFRTKSVAKQFQNASDGESLTYLQPIEIRENPSERLRFFGADYLRSSELLSLLLQPDDTLTNEENPENIAAKILSEYGTRALTAERNPGRMAELLGVTIEIASRVVAILELGRRFFEETTTRTPFIRSPEDAYKYLKDMALLKKEHLRGLYLNVQSRLIHDEIISIGTLSRSIVHPREVFAPALEHTAYAIILAHNHPSGDLTPSPQDIAVTKNISEAGRTLGIELLDHIIIGSNDFLSLKKEKLFS